MIFRIGIDIPAELLKNQPTGSNIKTSDDSDNQLDVTEKFGGKVSLIADILGTKFVIIRNGEYFASYGNLRSLNVSKGEKT